MPFFETGSGRFWINPKTVRTILYVTSETPELYIFTAEGQFSGITSSFSDTVDSIARIIDPERLMPTVQLVGAFIDDHFAWISPIHVSWVGTSSGNTAIFMDDDSFTEYDTATPLEVIIAAVARAND